MNYDSYAQMWKHGKEHIMVQLFKKWLEDAMLKICRTIIHASGEARSRQHNT